MLELAVDDLGVDLVRENHQVAFDGEPGDEFDVLFGQHAAGRVLGGVDDQQPGFVGDQGRQLLEVHPEVALLAEPDRDRLRLDEADQRLVDGIAGVGEDHLVAGLDAAQEREEEHVLGAGDHHHLERLDVGSEATVQEVGDRLPDLEDAPRRGVVGVVGVHRPVGGLDDVLGGREVGLPDFEVDDVLALGLERPGLGQHLEGTLGAEVLHPLSELERHLARKLCARCRRR